MSKPTNNETKPPMSKLFLRKYIIQLIIVTMLTALSCLSVNIFAIKKTGQLAQAIVLNPSPSLSANFKRALSIVLTKYTGNPHTMTLPTVRQQTKNISSLVRSYHYTQQSNPTTTTSFQTNTQQPYSLIVEFDTQAINNLLQATNQPLWNTNRPTTLVLINNLSKDNDNENYIDAQSAATNALSQYLSIAAKNRGLRLLFPIMDLTDQSNITDTPTTQSLNTKSLNHLAKRYSITSILAGTITHLHNQWQANWRYQLDGIPLNWQDQTNNIAQLTTNALNTITTTMLRQLDFSQNETMQQNAYLNINGVSNLSALNKLKQCINNLSIIDSINISNLSINTTLLEIHYHANDDSLIQNLQNNCQLKTADIPTIINNGISTFNFTKDGTAHD